MEATSTSARALTNGADGTKPPADLTKSAREEPRSASAQLPQRRAVRLWLCALSLVLLSLATYAWLQHGVEATDNAQVLADQIAIAPRETGVVLHVAIKDDQPVRTGDLLFQLDSADFAARAAQAEAEVATAQAQARAADAQVGIMDATARGTLEVARAAWQGSTNAVNGAIAQLEGARAELARARIEARRAEQDFRRAAELREKHAVSQEQLEIAQAAHDAAEATLARAGSQLTYAEEARRAAERKVGEAHGRLGQSEPVALQMEAIRAGAALAHGRLRAAEAALTVAKLQLEYTQVRAPTDGTISKVVVRTGQYVSAGQPMAQLVAQKTYVVANFKEDQIDEMRAGQRVEVRVDAAPGRVFPGRVTSIAAGTGAVFSFLAPDNATGNFIRLTQRIPVRIDWEREPALVLQSGLSAEVRVALSPGNGKD